MNETWKIIEKHLNLEYVAGNSLRDSSKQTNDSAFCVDFLKTLGLSINKKEVGDFLKKNVSR